MSQPKEVKRPSEKAASGENEMISARAHELYSQRGCVHGHDTEDWLRAEEEIRHKRTHRKAA